MQVDLNNKVALVTGAARGIGQAIADEFGRNGATVFYADIDEETARVAAESGSGKSLRMNVTDESEVNSGIARIVEECGHLDILVNNAGVNTLHKRVNINEFSTDEWRRVMEVDLNGLFFASRAGASAMLGGGGGRIINIASVVGLVPLRLQCAFAAAKAGVVNLTKAMALELGSQNILVNGIAPGSVLTDATRALFYSPDGSFNHAVQQLMDHIPLARPGTAQEIAHAALFLAAPESSYINGHILTVDGGWTAGYSRDF